MNRRVQLRKDANEGGDLRSSSDAENEVEEKSSTRGSDVETEDDSNSSGTGSDSGGDSESASDISEEANRPKESLKEISFGALAEAQAAFPPKSRKRKAPPDVEDDATQKAQRADGHHDAAWKQPWKSGQSKVQRPSKHAPTMLSSRQQVSRKRDIFEPSPALKARDPRFDPTIQASNHDRNAVENANKNYSFLTSYQAAEILELKSQIKKTKDPIAAAELKRQAMSIESKVRNAQARQRERGIVQQHKQKEKAAIAAGEKAKPYYLKEGEVRKLANQERMEGMSKKARDKAAARKQKREKTKEARDMPRVRRE